MLEFDAEALYQLMLDKIRATYGTQFSQPDSAVLVGIWSGGAWLAERLAADLGAPNFGVLNISLHRDDYPSKGLPCQPQPTSLPFDINGRRLLLVDDVLYTGRTIRAAINELYDFGRPAAVELAVLIARSGRELPIAANFVGSLADIPPNQKFVLHREHDKFVLNTEKLG